MSLMLPICLVYFTKRTGDFNEDDLGILQQHDALKSEDEFLDQTAANCIRPLTQIPCWFPLRVYRVVYDKSPGDARYLVHVFLSVSFTSS